MLKVMIAAETTEVKKMDGNCEGKWKEYSERADRGPGKRRKQRRNRGAAENKPPSGMCACAHGVVKHTHTHTQIHQQRSRN